MKLFLDEFGIKIQSPFFHARFGNLRFNDQNLSQLYAQDQVLRVNQTHSTDCVEASTTIVSADAHYTQEISKWLLVRTADCIPILGYSEQSKKVFAIHAGWRGLINGIIENSFEKIKIEDPFQFKLLIGPHIGPNSFFIREDVLGLFLDKKDFNIESKDWLHLNGDKYRVNLLNILIGKLKKLGFSDKNILSFPIDTVAAEDWNSFRRDGQNSGRNLSLIKLV